MTKFKEDNLTAEDAFWVMWYFLQEQYELSNNTFEVSDILSASEPKDWDGSGIKRPADNGMIDFWNEALKNTENKENQIGKNWKNKKKPTPQQLLIEHVLPDTFVCYSDRVRKYEWSDGGRRCV